MSKYFLKTLSSFQIYLQFSLIGRRGGALSSLLYIRMKDPGCKTYDAFNVLYTVIYKYHASIDDVSNEVSIFNQYIIVLYSSTE